MRIVICAAFALCAASSALAEPRWTMVRTPTLTVIGDQSAATLRNVASEMEQFRAVVGGLFPNADRPLALPTTVFVFGDRKSAQDFIPLAGGGKPAQIAGYFSRGQDMNAILISLEGFAEAGPIIYHEYTHLLVGNAVRSVPVWLNEGLAEYYSTYTLASGGKAAEVGRPIARHIALLRERYTPLADLIAVDRTSNLYDEGRKRSSFYAQSWALVHYLMAEMKGGPAAIERYASAIANGAEPGDAFHHAFGSTPAEFDKRLRDYVRRMTYAGQRFIFDAKLPPPRMSDPKAVTPGEANAWLGDLQRRIGRDDEGARRIEAAVQSDPSSSMPQLALGLLRLAQDRDAEGLDALKRAAELGADDFTMQFIRGLWLLRTSYRDPQGAAPAAIPALKRAAELKPDSAEAFGWLAYAQMRQPSTLADARVSIDRALELAPGQAALRIRWAHIVALQGGFDAAKEALQDVAARTSDPVASDAASASLDSLERDGKRDAPEAAEAAARAADEHTGVPGTERSLEAKDRVAPDLRKIRPGEVRVWGLLVRIDCSPTEVRFHVRGGSRTVVAIAPRMEDVDLISHLDEKDFTIACGRRVRPDSIYITWKPGDSLADGLDGKAVAVEFLPRGFIP